MTTFSSTTAGNPYRYGLPIREPEWFFGREEQLGAIVHRLSKRESAALIGERRSGKTSLLFQLMDAEVRRRYTPEADNLIHVYITPELGVRDPATFFYEVLRSLAEQGLLSDLPAGGTASHLQMRDCVSQLLPRRLVILLDEFDGMVKSGSFPREFFAFLRGLAQSYEVGYVTATREDLFQCCPVEVLASPFPNIFTPIFIGSFEKGIFDEFMAETGRRSGVSLDRHKDSILALAGRFPFFVQMACSHYYEFESKGDGSEGAADREVISRFDDDARPHMETIWSRYLSEEERKAISALSRGRVADASVIHRLTQKGYVVDGRIFSSVLAQIERQHAGGVESAVASPLTEPSPAAQGIWVDRDSGDVWVEGRRIEPLTRLEYDLLSLLYENRGKICDKYRIVEVVWSDRYIDIVGDSRIAKLVDRLRDKVEPDPAHPRYIVTIHGRGYRLAIDPDQAPETT